MGDNIERPYPHGIGAQRGSPARAHAGLKNKPAGANRHQAENPGREKGWI